MTKHLFVKVTIRFKNTKFYENNITNLTDNETTQIMKISKWKRSTLLKHWHFWTNDLQWV